MMRQITGIILTKNEEKNIAEALQCLDFCAEVLVVDSLSTDGTTEIAALFPNVKILKKKFDDFTTQRNFGIQNAENEWIMMLDCDERITPKLREEILQEIEHPKNDAYFFYRKFFFEGRPIHFSGTQTDKNFRLFRKLNCQYISDKKVHETLEVRGSIGIFKNKLLHFSVPSAAEYREKMKHYAALKACELGTKRKKYSAFLQIGKSTFTFFKDYVLRLGFLDGRDGLRLCRLHAYYVFMTYENLRKKP